MATLSLNDRTFDIDLVVFDKDGTLIDLHYLWGQKANLWVEGLVEQVNGDDALRQLLSRTIAYDPQRNRAITHSPLAVGTMADLYTIAATVLYQHGFGWHDAQDGMW
jgi:phosphoglycolate phosphatase-like HAD superfamily hydrolase